MKKDVNDSILTLRVPKSLIEAIDQAARKAERERSDWIRRTLKKATEGQR
jgi:metal-responsive CopG/Arc/MetJ family transcriptional regulator